MAGILIVEDQALIATMLAASVEHAGHRVIGPVASVQAALDAIAHASPDAAMLDVNLSRGETSYPVAAELARRSVPYAFMTGIARENLDPAFATARVICKPFTDEAVRSVVADLVSCEH